MRARSSRPRAKWRSAKPIIVIKAGRSVAAARAAASHTGTLTGSDEVLDAAFRRSGVLRVNSIAELFYMAEVLGKQPRPRGPRLSIVTNAGAPGVLATDALVANGGRAERRCRRRPRPISRRLLPPHWSHGNPIDLLDDAGPERYVKALEIAAADSNSDGLLVILTPQAMTDPTQTAELLRQRVTQFEKPLLASWMGGVDVAAGERMLNKAGIPTFPYPDTAARVFFLMWRHSYKLRGLYETPALPVDVEGVERRRGGRCEDHRVGAGVRPDAADRGRVEAGAGRLRHSRRRDARRPQPGRSGGDCAADLGYPVVVKLYSHDDHAQDRRGRRAVEPPGRGGGAPGVRPHRERGVGEGGAPSTPRA